jgi:hypothetical protein
VRFSSASRRGAVGRGVKAGTRLAILAALVGQLAALAHGALVAHVTCGLDGDLVHLRAGAPAPAPSRDVVREVSSGDDDSHDRCLLDEDGEALCPTSHVASGQPLSPSRARSPIAQRVRALAAPAPLYRLAPKNSPPA